MKFEPLTRREFAGAAAVSTVLSQTAYGAGGRRRNADAISRQSKPLAIAMWDFSWILRHHRLGEFENWDQCLDELAERGYNAIRIDAMPHLVAPDAQGRVVEEVYFPRDSWQPVYHGNNYSIRVRPRDALVEFLPKCYRRGFLVGLATWFMGPIQRFDSEDGLFRAWAGTLDFLEKNGLLERVLYVDVLNEYPNVHGFDWLKRALKERADPRRFRELHPDVQLLETDFEPRKGRYTSLQKRFFNEFLRKYLGQLRERWPQFDFHASLDRATKIEDIDLANFDVLDYHMWFHQNPEMEALGLSQMFSHRSDERLEEVYRKVKTFWAGNRPRMIDWMSGWIHTAAQGAARHNIPCGNTEGWGAVGWADHPALDWEWIKECGEISVDLALENKYRFICTSNYTHPQFPGLWRDLKWHRKLTGKIRA